MIIKVEKDIEVSLHDFGAQLATANDEEQAQFFNAFALTLVAVCGGEHEMQMIGISDNKEHPMLPDTKEFFKSMVYFTDNKETK